MRRKNDKKNLRNVHKTGVAFDIEEFHLLHLQDCHLSCILSQEPPSFDRLVMRPVKQACKILYKFVEGSIFLLWCWHDSFMNDVNEECCSTQQIYGELSHATHTLSILLRCFRPCSPCLPCHTDLILLPSHMLVQKIKKSQCNTQLKLDNWRE